MNSRWRYKLDSCAASKVDIVRILSIQKGDVSEYPGDKTYKLSGVTETSKQSERNWRTRERLR